LSDERERAIALLEATHQFPVLYHLSVITLSSDEVLSRVREALQEGLGQPLGDHGYETVPSRGGKYASHRFKVPCRRAEDVLAIYERLRQVDGVVTVM
jgi:putative lipoic acid-binding regulatory protein